jgi:hypothetical protein
MNKHATMATLSCWARTHHHKRSGKGWGCVPPLHACQHGFLVVYDVHQEGRALFVGCQRSFLELQQLCNHHHNLAGLPWLWVWERGRGNLTGARRRGGGEHAGAHWASILQSRLDLAGCGWVWGGGDLAGCLGNLVTNQHVAMATTHQGLPAGPRWLWVGLGGRGPRWMAERLPLANPGKLGDEPACNHDTT